MRKIFTLLAVVFSVAFSHAQQPGGKYKILEATENLIPAPDTVTAPKVLGEIRRIGAALYSAISLSGSHKWTAIASGTITADSLNVINIGSSDTYAPYWIPSTLDALGMKTFKGENGVKINPNFADSSLHWGLTTRANALSTATTGDTTNLQSGDASLTLTGITNISSVSSATGIYTRVGNVVEVDILIGFTPTAGAATFTEIDCTMPIMPEVPANQRINGSYHSFVDYGLVGSSPAAINKVRISFYSNFAASNQANVHYSYKIK